MMTAQRKKNLSDFAGVIAGEFSNGYVTQLEQIAASEDIEVYVDHYENVFDGMLVVDDDRSFHLHLNIDRGNLPSQKRGRFSYAHELAHFFIEEHRIPLMTGEKSPHGSLHDFGQKDDIEKEADYFASCLLMPEAKFRRASRDKKFSTNTIQQLSAAFNTSFLATVLRFVEIGSHPILVVISEKNIVKWFAKSQEFHNFKFRFQVGQSLPPLTVAGEYFKNPELKHTDIEDVDLDSWFIPSWLPETQMHEQCYYSTAYRYVISLIWFD